MKLELLPAILSWGTLILLALASWQIPVWVAVGIILFDTYWVLKTIYLTFHLRSAYMMMRQNLKKNWMRELDELKINPVRNCRGVFDPATIGHLDPAPIRIGDKGISNGIKDKGLKIGGIHPVREITQVIQPRPSTGEARPEISGEIFSNGVKHLVLLPMYKEPHAVVRETLETLANSDFPLANISIVLGLEERGGLEAQAVGDQIQKEYASRFGGFLLTTHPSNLPGEIPGKGSNETWMIKEAIDKFNLRSDQPRPEPSPTLDYETPALSFPQRFPICPRVLEWEQIAMPMVRESPPERTVQVRAGRLTQNLDPGSEAGMTEKYITRNSKSSTVHNSQFTIHSSDSVLVSVFDVDTQVPSGFFSRLTYLYLTTPDPDRVIYQPIPLFSNNMYQAPALARVIALSCTFWQMMQQARPDRLTSFSSQSIPLKALRDIGFWHTDVVSEDSRIFWQCLIHYRGDFRVVPMLYPISMDINTAGSFWRTLLNLYKQQRRWAWGVENTPYLLREFSKHKEIPAKTRRYWAFHVLQGFHSWATNSLIIFALGWLPVTLGGRAFNYSLLSYNLPKMTQYIISFSMVGIASCAVLGLLMLPPRPKGFRFRSYFPFVLEWLLVPVVLIVFGSIPALESQTRLALGGKFRLGFWVTPKSR